MKGPNTLLIISSSLRIIYFSWADIMLVKALIGNVRARFTDMSSISIWALEYSSAVSPLLNTSLRLLLKKIPHKNAIQPIAVNIKRKIPLRRYMES